MVRSRDCIFQQIVLREQGEIPAQRFVSVAFIFSGAKFNFALSEFGDMRTFFTSASFTPGKSIRNGETSFGSKT